MNGSNFDSWFKVDLPHHVMWRLTRWNGFCSSVCVPASIFTCKIVSGPWRLGDRHWDPKIRTEEPRQTTVTYGNLELKRATMFLPTFWLICIEQRKTVGTCGYPSPPAITPVTKWIDKDEPSPFLRTHSIIFTSSSTLPRPLVYKLQ